jgi:hypothetical protein
MPDDRHACSLEITNPDRPSVYVNLGPHPPRLWPEDVDLLHKIWLHLSEEPDVGSKIHHRDVVGIALRRLEQELHTNDRREIIRLLENESHRMEVEDQELEPD